MVGKAIFTQPNKISNLILAEQWVDFNFCRLMATVKVGLTGATEPIRVGEVLYRDSAAPTSPFIRCEAGVALPSNITVCVCVDDRVGEHSFLNVQQTSGWGVIPNIGLGKKQIDWGATSTDEITCSVIFRGDCLLREDALIFGTYEAADAGKKNSIISNLTSRDMRFTKRMAGLFQNIPPYRM